MSETIDRPKFKELRFNLKRWVDPLTQAQVFEILNRIGAMVPNEMRKELDLPKIEDDWADLPYNFNFPPQRMEMEQAAAAANQTPSADQEKKFMSILMDLNNYTDEMIKAGID